MWPPRRSTYSRVLPPLLLALGLAGCRNSGELVEAELRTRERELRETQEEVARLKFHNEALQQQLWSAYQGPVKVPPEQAALVTSVRRVVLGRLTGGYGGDRTAGDAALQVVIEPRDERDQRLKAPGAVHVEALEIS